MADLPPGFTLDEPAADLPPGFKLDEPKPPGPPPTRLQRFAMGAGDIIQGGAQLAVNALPEGVVGAVNDATQYVNDLPVVGPVTRALGMVPGTREGINQQTAKREGDYQAARQAGGDTGIDWMRMTGNAASAIPLAAALPLAATIPGAIAAGSLGGVASAALEPVAQGEYWGGKQNQLMTGGVIGAATGPLGLLAGRAIAPRIAPNVRTLEAAGVEMTPGQIIGGATRRVEDAATSVPILGDQIKSAQRNSLESFNRATANRVLQPIGETVERASPVGREMVEDVGGRISQAYDRAIAQAKPFGPDQQFADAIAEVGDQFLTPQSRQIFINTLQDKVISRMQGGPIDGATYQTIKSELGRIASRYGGSQNAAEQEIGEAFGGVQRAMQDLLARSNPEVAPALRAADHAFAGNVRLENAAGRVGATDGVFTAPQLASAVRSTDRSLRHRDYARGNALLQDLSDAGRGVLPNTVPDSGTPSRLLMAGLAGGTATGMINPALAAGAGLAYGAYTPAIQKAIAAALLARRPTAINALGESIAGAGGLAAGVIGGEASRPTMQRNRLLND